MQKITFLTFLITLSLHAQVPQWQWAKNYALHFNSGRQYSALDGQGNLYVAADFSSPTLQAGAHTINNISAGTGDIYLIKFDPQGNVLWASGFGGPDQDSLIAMECDAQGNLYLTGTFTYSIAFGSNTLSSIGQSTYLAKLAPNGSPLWAKTQNNNNALQWESQSLAVDLQGNLIVGGAFVGQSLSFDGESVIFDNALDNSGHTFVGKFDPNGNCIWLRGAQTQEPHFMGSVARAVGVDQEGAVYVAGRFGNPSISFGDITLTKTSSQAWNTNLYFVKYNADGQVEWATRSGSAYSNPTDATAVAIDAQGNALLSGYFSNTIQVGGIELDAGASASSFIAKFDASGSVDWARAVTASGCASTHNSIDTDAQGGVYLSGFTNCQNIGFGDGIELNFTGQGHLYVAKYNAEGQAQWARQSGNATAANYSSISVMNPGEIYVAGTFPTPTITFGSTTLTKTSDNYNLFVAKLYSAALGIDRFDMAKTTVAPVPASESVSIRSAEYPISYTITDASGKTIKSGTIASDREFIEIGHLSKGLYFLTLPGAGTHKIIKE